MRGQAMFYSLVATLGGAGAASAGCILSGDPGAVARPINVGADARLVIAMSVMPKLMHIDYAKAAADKPSCELGQFTAGGRSYQLYGEDKPGRVRKAMPAQSGDPIAQIIPVTDIMKAVEASKEGKTAAVDGYLLATLTPSDFTGWRYYTGVPDGGTLKQDMADALSGGMSPIFRNSADGKTAIFLPKK